MNIGNALIGFSGFVGSTLLKQGKFNALYRSTNINEIENQHFDTVVCAGAPAQKWLANKEPAEDRKKIETLIGHLKTIRCNRFILISTVDVFKNPNGVDESTPIEEEGLNPYGLHRRFLEKFVEGHFSRHLIVRLPGLVGPGLRKNVVYDFLNNNNVNTIESRGIFQFYPMVNLWYDIETAIKAGLSIIHLTAEPVRVSDISLLGFGTAFDQNMPGVPANYDMQTRYADIFGSKGRYQYSARESIQAVRAYAQSEPMMQRNSTGARS